MPFFVKAQIVFWIVFFISIIPLFIIYRFWFFFRKPNRKIPSGDNIVSPADGYVLYIRKIKKSMASGRDSEVPISVKKGKKIYLKELSGLNEKFDLVIGIFMTPVSVHYNRFPFAGKVGKNFYRSVKKNKSMLLVLLNILFNIKPATEGAEYIYENERNTITLKNKKVSGAVVQIASTWIDNIKNRNIKPGYAAEKGEVFGMIRMGSQCDLFLKIKGRYKIRVKEKEYVKAGSSVLIDL